MKPALPVIFRSIKTLLATALLAFTATAFATPVGPMNYQGRLLDEQGIPVTATHDFRVSIYDDPSAGTLKYQEVISSVSVDDGVYSFKIGLGPKTGGDSLWDVALWQGNLNNLHLELEVHNGVSYEVLTPRHELTSAPHAYTATLALSLGNRTAEEFDNILEGICVADKGKWLATADRCAGNGSDLSSALWSDLDPSSDYSNLSFDGTDFNGSNFSTVDFSGAIIKDANIDSANFNGGNFTGATIDGATFTTPPTFASADLTDANLLNMDLSGVDLSTATLTNISGAKLTGCTAVVLPIGWECVEQISGQWALIGANANYSETSAGLISRYGLDNYLNLVSFGTVTDISNSDFSGVFTNITFDTLTVQNALFDYSQIMTSIFQSVILTGTYIRDAILDWAIFNGSDLENVYFDWSVISNSTFEWAGMLNTSFYSAYISNTVFDSINNGSTYHDGVNPVINFQYASFRGVRFDTSDISGSEFSDIYMTETDFIDTVNDEYALLYFQGARLDQVNFITSQNPIYADFYNAALYSVDFSGENFYYSFFDYAYFYNCYFDGTDLTFTSFDNATIEYTSFDGADLSNATFAGATFYNVSWTGATCPDGNPETNGAQTDSCEDQLL